MIVSAVLYQVEMPLKQAFGHAQGTRTRSENIVLRLDVDGITGLGECAPRVYVTGESLATAFDAIQSFDLTALEPALSAPSFEAGVATLEAMALPVLLGTDSRRAPAAAAAVELAVLDALGKRFARPVSAVFDALGLPSSLRRRPDESEPPVVIPFDLARSVDDFIGSVRGLPPPHLVKVKLDASPGDARVSIAREAIGPTGRVAVDANMAWSLPFAIDQVASLEKHDIAWYEEPLARGDLDAYRELRKRTGARIMLDESLTSTADALAAVRAEAADLFNIRISKSGGLVGALRMAEVAHTHGIGYQSGIQVAEFGILGAAARAFRSVVGQIVAIERLGTTRLLPEDIVQSTAASAPDSAPGLGVHLVEATLEKYITRRAHFGCGALRAGWSEGHAESS